MGSESAYRKGDRIVNSEWSARNLFFWPDSAVLFLFFMDKDEDDAVTSRERVADFISGVMQARVNTPVGRADSGVMKCEYTVCDDCDASHFFSQFCIVKNTVSGHGFVI